jgi:dephospho-CoA kinase
MLIVGLTGSVGMGKSTIAARLRERGIPVFDADAEVHRLYENAAVEAIETAFPGSTADGKVDRRKLATMLAGKPERFSILEGIVHPLVREAERQFLCQAATEGAHVAVLEIPLLYETGGDALVDVVIVASAPADVQRARVLSRLGMDQAKFAELVSRQIDDAEKRRRADFVVDTGGTHAWTIDQTDEIMGLLASREGSAYHRFWA